MPNPASAAHALCRSTAEQAFRSVELPESVIDILTGVRNYLQVRYAGSVEVLGALGGLCRGQKWSGGLQWPLAAG
jgi:hypothetical protein